MRKKAFYPFPELDSNPCSFVQDIRISFVLFMVKGTELWPPPVMESLEQHYRNPVFEKMWGINTMTLDISISDGWSPNKRELAFGCNTVPETTTWERDIV